MSERWTLTVELPRIDPIRTEVTICLGLDSSPPSTGGHRLDGHLRGPVCALATTLPMTVPLLPFTRSVSSGGQLTARAVLTEPGFWTPDLPMLYELSVEVETATSTNETVAEGRGHSRTAKHAINGHIGLRRLWASDRSILLDGHRLVIRGVTASENVAVDDLRSSRTSLVACDPSSATRIATVADRAGIVLVVRFDAEQAAAAAVIALRHPSIGFVVTRSPEAAKACRFRATRGRGLVGLEVDAALPPPNPAPEADFLVAALPLGGLPHPAWIDPPRMPLMASRVDTAGDDPRLSCDALQADLAAWGSRCSANPRRWDWSGYLIDRR